MPVTAERIVMSSAHSEPRPHVCNLIYSWKIVPWWSRTINTKKKKTPEEEEDNYGCLVAELSPSQ